MNMAMLPNRVLRYLVVAGLLIQGAFGQSYTYLWQPRSADVSGPQSKDYLILSAVLRLSRPQNYTVRAGDSLDFIIRKRFLVSAQFKNAYKLYFARVLELNPDLPSVNMIHTGQVLSLPGGPKFSATELSDLPVSRSSRDAQFNSLSKEAYELSSTAEEHLNRFATRTLSAFVLADPKISLPAASGLIKTRGLVGAINLGAHPRSEVAQMQPIDIYPAGGSSDTEIADIKAADGARLFLGTFPMSVPISIPCPNCLKCPELLKVPPGVDISKARILIEDTGFNNGSIDPSRIIQQVPESPGLPAPVSTDSSADKHGTFIFSQIAAAAGADGTDPNRGVIPKNQLYVARVVRNGSDGTLQYSMSDIAFGWKAFETILSKDRESAQTWVVNLSMFGENKDDADVTPSPPRSDHLLIVAAAGNHGSPTEASLIAFPRLSGPGNSLVIVGALNTSNQRASYSNYDPSMVQLFARGDCICGSPGQLNGTSQAAPVVASAAAILASARPTMKPLDVMWRLISSADRNVNGTAYSLGGTVNLANALDRSILLIENRGGATGQIHRISDVILPSDVLSDLSGNPINEIGKELLRLSLISESPQTCFAVIRELVLSETKVCAQPGSEIQYTENGQQKSIKSANVKSIILPLPSDRDPQLLFPEVAVGSIN
jgi:subtilisin family serine protease